MRITTTEVFRKDLLEWLNLCWEDINSNPFANISPELQKDIIAKLDYLAITQSVISPSDFLLRILRHNRTEKYYDFKLLPRHFKIDLESEFLTAVMINQLAPASPEKVSELLVSKEEFLDIEVPEIVFSRYEPQIFNGLNIKFGGRTLERLKRVVDQMPSDNIPVSNIGVYSIEAEKRLSKDLEALDNYIGTPEYLALPHSEQVLLVEQRIKTRSLRDALRIRLGMITEIPQ